MEGIKKYSYFWQYITSVCFVHMLHKHCKLQFNKNNKIFVKL